MKWKEGSGDSSALHTSKDRNACAGVDLGKKAESAVNIIITSHKTIIMVKFPAATINKAITAA